MEAFWKVIAAVLLAAVLGLSIARQEKDIAMLLSLAVCCMAGTVMLTYLRPVLSFLKELSRIGKVDNALLETLFRCAAIGLTAELTAMICRDAGKESLGKMVYMLSSCVILYLSIPVFQMLIASVQDILGVL